jgi:hypothetical protein
MRRPTNRCVTRRLLTLHGGDDVTGKRLLDPDPQRATASSCHCVPQHVVHAQLLAVARRLRPDALGDDLWRWRRLRLGDSLPALACSLLGSG